jgi:pimeloyl-ACP methyl ester carboxylesterase
MPDVAGARHRFVTTDGIRLHVAEAGDPRAPVVLLLHGFPQHWFMWRHLIEPLARTHRVVALDFRGFGWSDAPARGYSTAARVKDVLAVMDELDIDRADVVGHDWGALVAFYLALDHPSRVNRLVSVSMVHLWPLQRHLAPSTWRWWVTALFEWPVLGSWMLRRRPRVAGWLLARDAVDIDVWTEELRGIYTSRLTEPARARAGQRLHAWLVLGMPRLLLGGNRRRRFDIPTLVLGGDHDALIPAHVLTVPAHRSTTIAVRAVPGGHFLVDEHPDQMIDAILEHLSSPLGAEV